MSYSIATHRFASLYNDGRGVFYHTSVFVLLMGHPHMYMYMYVYMYMYMCMYSLSDVCLNP